MKENGIYYYSKSESKYEGEWKNGKKRDKGIYYYKNVKYYIGAWENDNMNENGIFYYIII